MGLSFLQEATTLYAVVLHSLIVILVLVQAISCRVSRRRSGSLSQLLRGLCPPYLYRLLLIGHYHLFTSDSSLTGLLQKYDLLAPWKLQHALALVVYIAANAVSTFTGSRNLAIAGLRAGRLAMVNAAVLYAGLHLGFLADKIGVGVFAYQRIHRVASLTVFLLSAFHIVVAALDQQNRQQLTSRYLFALLAGIAVVFQSLLFPLLRRLLWYEPALRIHQLGAVWLAFATLRHVGSGWYIYALLPGVYLLLSSLVPLFTIFCRQGMTPCTVVIEYDRHMTSLRLRVPGRLPLGPGQYLNLWMPLKVEGRPFDSLLASLFSPTWWQSHPLMVVRWSNLPEDQRNEIKQGAPFEPEELDSDEWEAEKSAYEPSTVHPVTELHLIVQPRHGWTRRLHSIAKLGLFPLLILWDETRKLQLELAQDMKLAPLHSDVRHRQDRRRVEEIGQRMGQKEAALLALREKRIAARRASHTFALFSGPHGRTSSTEGYRNLLVVAEQFSIIRCMSYVRTILQEQQIAYGKAPPLEHGNPAALERFLLVYETTTEYWDNKAIQTFLNEILEKEPTATDRDDSRASLPGSLEMHRTANSAAVPARRFEVIPYVIDGASEDLSKRAKVVHGPIPLNEVLERELQWAKKRELERELNWDRKSNLLILSSVQEDKRRLLLQFMNRNLHDVNVVDCGK